MNPDPGIIESYVMLNEEDGEPGVLAISDDSRYLYVGMAGAVKRIDLATMTPDLDIPTGYYPTGSMTVLPGVNTSLVVTHTSGAAAVFDGARKRPNELGGGGALRSRVPDRRPELEHNLRQRWGRQRWRRFL